MRVIGYLRVSTAEQAISGLGLDAQREAIERGCEHHPDRELVRIVADEGYSGKTINRPALLEALSDIAEGRADALVVYKLDRLTRRNADLGLLVEWFLDVDAGGLIALDFEGLDTSRATGKMIATIIVAVAEWERDSDSERTVAALAALRARGKPISRPAVADQPELADRIKGMRANGMTLQAIADTLATEGVPTIRGGQKWRPSSVQAAAGYKRPRPRRQAPELPAPRRGRARA